MKFLAFLLFLTVCTGIWSATNPTVDLDKIARQIDRKDRKASTSKMELFSDHFYYTPSPWTPPEPKAVVRRIAAAEPVVIQKEASFREKEKKKVKEPWKEKAKSYPPPPPPRKKKSFSAGLKKSKYNGKKYDGKKYDGEKEYKPEY